MDSKHTPEPWKKTRTDDNCPQVSDSRGKWDSVICRMGSYTHGHGASGNDAFANAEANAARVVTCVNALADIPDPAQFVAAARKDNAVHFQTLCDIRAVVANLQHGNISPESAVDILKECISESDASIKAFRAAGGGASETEPRG